MHTLDILDEGHALLFQERGEVAERQRMPFNRLRAVVLTAMVEDVLLNRGAQSAFPTSSGTFARLNSGLCRSIRPLLFVGRIKRHRTPPIQERHSQERGRYSHHSVPICNLA